VAERQALDGNEAAALVAHKLSEVIAIYPITPASRMGELADAWSAGGRPNLWGQVPTVVEMQSEGGAAGAVHGAAQAGALTTTFTASQGLLLMLPDMFKLAGELTSVVIHVAARALATHALSIFGDHSDVMAARSTGFALLSSASVQEAHDLALVAHAATLEGRVPFLHFFDGFRTSHEINLIDTLTDDDVRALVSDDWIAAHRLRSLSPDRPVVRGTAQNPDVFFQAREAANRYYDALPGIVQGAMDRLGERTGRQYHLVDYHGAPDAERVIVIMGSAGATVRQTVGALQEVGEKVGVLSVRLFRPFPVDALLAALPAGVRRIAVLDRTKEPGAVGEPLFQDVVCALASSGRGAEVIGGRYGLASKELTPAMAKAVFDELSAPRPRRGFTVGIDDDVTHLSLAWDPSFTTETDDVVRAVFYGLGSDGTVGANKASVKILADLGHWAQGYFVYDSKKSGSMTVSHLRFGPDRIDSPYLIDAAGFVAVHAFGILSRVDALAIAALGATVLLSCPWPAEQVWDRLPTTARRHIVDKGLDVWSIDAFAIARDAGLGGRTNTILQTCFLSLSGILSAEQAASAVKTAAAAAYAKRGADVVARNEAAVEGALAGLRRVHVPAGVPHDEAERLGRGDLISELLADRGNLVPVSAFAPDGTFPTGTAKREKRSIANEIPVWDPGLCIDCAKCAIACPHAAIRTKVYEPVALGGAPDGFQNKAYRSREMPGMLLTIGIAPDDCTGCGICVEVCPATSKVDGHRSLEMAPKEPDLASARMRWDFFGTIPPIDRSLVAPATVKGSQLLEPLFEFSGACAGCGETPYLKLLSQLFGDRIVVANATGCSSIFGGNLPTTPWTKDACGRGPAWSNSLFEDNAEFGLGVRLGLDSQAATARARVEDLRDTMGSALADRLLHADQTTEAGIALQRSAVADLRSRLGDIDDPAARQLEHLADHLSDKIVWIVGGDGWAYDIGFGGLDHVLASGANVNVLVLDTEVYSNTGGQASKATPRGARAKFATAGKHGAKKDLAAMIAGYGHVYVAQIALGANPLQATKVLAEAAAHPGPSLVVAYAHCIEHGIDMAHGMDHQREAVASGYWPIWRYDPRSDPHLHLDCRPPSLDLSDFYASEDRFVSLVRTNPADARALEQLASADIKARWARLQALATAER
jgi:pyruvate-ferredoxin/flavodoxin oxidoreductase